MIAPAARRRRGELYGSFRGQGPGRFCHDPKENIGKVRILTVIKRVPDSNATLKVKPDGSGIEEAGLKHVIDPFDEFGVEQGIRLKEKRSDVEEVVALTVGPETAGETIRQALAMGVDRAIHVCDDAFESRDELFLASVLAAAIRRQETPFDLILCGKQTIDQDSGQIAPALAEYLNLPHVGAVTKLEVADDGSSFKANRRIEGAEEIVECSLPALISCEKGLAEPRYPSLPNLMKAKRKPVEKLTAADLDGLDAAGAGTTFESLSPPPPRPPCTFLEGEPEEMAAELIRLLREEAKAI